MKQVLLAILGMELMMFSLINDSSVNLAAQPSNLITNGDNNVRVEADPHLINIAYEYIVTNYTKFRIKTPSEDLALIDWQKDNLGFNHLKFQQIINNVPVWGSSITVHINSSDIVYKVTGHPYHTLQDVKTSPALMPKEACYIAEHASQDASNDWHTMKTVLYLYPYHSALKLVYEITITQGLMRNFVIVDAMDGKILKTLSGTPTQIRGTHNP